MGKIRVKPSLLERSESLTGPSIRAITCTTSTSSIDDEPVVHLTSQFDLLESPSRRTTAAVTKPSASEPSSQQPRSIYHFMRRDNRRKSTNRIQHPQTVPKAANVDPSTSNQKVNNEAQKKQAQPFDKSPEEQIQKVMTPVLKTFGRPEKNPEQKFRISKRKPSEFTSFVNAETSPTVPISTDEEGTNVALFTNPISVDFIRKPSTKKARASGKLALRNATQGNLKSDPQKEGKLLSRKHLFEDLEFTSAASSSSNYVARPPF